MTGLGPISAAAHSAGTERELAELGRRLGPRYRLDGTLGSLFAVEEVLIAVRRLGAPAAAVPWMPSYLGRLLARAYAELGLPTAVSGLVLRTQDYAVDLGEVVQRLVHPPLPFPLGAALSLPSVDPRVGPAFTPHWFLGALLRAHPFGSTSATRDRSWLQARIVEVRPWLARQHAWFASGNHPRLVTLALRAAEALACPPFSHPDDPDGNAILHTLVQTAATWPDQEAVQLVARRLLTYQDRFALAIAARLCLSLEIPPTSAQEASGLVETLEPGRRGKLWGPVRDELDRYAPVISPLLFGLEEPLYAQGMDLSDAGQHAEAVSAFSRLLNAQPRHAAAYCARGHAGEGAGQIEDRILRDYADALELVPNYVQALLNRGVFHARRRRFEESDRDLFAALLAEPDLEHVRRNLLVGWFARRMPDASLSPRPGPSPVGAAAGPSASPAPRAVVAPVARAATPPSADLLVLTARIAQLEQEQRGRRREVVALDDRAQLAEQVGRDGYAKELRAHMASLEAEVARCAGELAALEHERREAAAGPAGDLGGVRGRFLQLLLARQAALPRPPVVRLADDGSRAGAKAVEAQAAPKPAPPKAQPAAAKAQPAAAKAQPAAAKAQPAAAKAQPAAAKAPPRFGPYEIVGLLGEGGMGKVFRVRRDDWGMDLALKLPRGRVDARTRARLVQETDAWAALGLHPFVATCYFALVIDEVPWIFAELVEGGSLADAIGSKSLYRGEPEEVLARMLDVGWQTALGLHHAHERGLIHQDVKPGNVLFTSDGRAKVTDFGLARTGVRDEAGPKRSGNVTMMAQFAGMTPAYCSPEQAAASDGARNLRITRRSDLWSWAASLLEVFVGQLSWMFGPAAGAALAIYGKEGPRIASIPRMPDGLFQLLERCFEKAESDRPATLLEVADAIGDIHERALGRPPRRPRVGTYDGADELYNRGTSAAALGDLDRALTLWDEALEADPQHAHAAFGSAVLRWRLGHIGDEEAVRSVDEVRQFAALRDCGAGPAKLEHAEAEELVAWVHAERGLVGSARDRLDEAARLRGGGDGSDAELLRPALLPSITSALHLRGVDAVSLGPLSADGERVLLVPASDPSRIVAAPTGSGAVTTVHQGRAAIGRLGATADLTRVVFVEGDKVWIWRAGGGGAVALEGLPSAGPDIDVAIAADGRRAAAAHGRFVVVHEVDPSGAPTRQSLIACVETVFLVALAERPHLFAYVSTSSSHDLVLLDGERGVFARVGVPGPVRSLAWDPSGEHAVVAGVDTSGRGFLGRWATAASAIAPMWLRTEPGPAACVAVSRAGGAALTLAVDGAIRRWSTAEGRCLTTLRGAGAEGPLAVSLGGDGERAIVIDREHRVRRLDFAARLPAKSFKAVRPTASEELFARQQTFARKIRDARAALADDRAEDALATLAEIRAERWSARLPETRALWSELADRAHRGPLSAAWPAREIAGDGRPILAVEITPDGASVLVVRAGSSDLVVHDVVTGAVTRTLSHEAPVSALAVSLRGDVWVTAAGHTVRIEHSDGRSACIELPWTPERVSLSGDGRRVVALRGELVRVIDLSAGVRGELVAQLGATRDLAVPLFRASVSHDGTEALVATREGVLRVLLDEATPPAVLHEGDGALDVVWSPAGDVVLVGHRSGRLRRLSLGAQASEQVGEAGAAVTGVAATYDGRLAVTVDESGAVGVWSLPNPRRVAVLSGHTAQATDVALTPSGRHAVTGGHDGRVRIWNLGWELVAVPEGRVLDARATALVARAVAAGAPDALVRTELAWSGAGHLSEDVVARATAAARRG